VIAYSPPNDIRTGDRLGVFITPFRNNPDGYWRLLVAIVTP
jgi:hypothetical protein